MAELSAENQALRDRSIRVCGSIFNNLIGMRRNLPSAASVPRADRLLPAARPAGRNDPDAALVCGDPPRSPIPGRRIASLTSRWSIDTFPRAEKKPSISP
jgi:hypothetical protein